MLFVAATAFGFGPGRAEAQFGIGGGGGFGWGFGGFSQVPNRILSCTRRRLIDARRNTHIPSRDVYANNPNSYINHIRDNGFVDRYDVARRDPAYYRYSPLRSSRPEDDPDGDDRDAADTVVAPGQLLQRRGPHRLARRCTNRRRPEREAVDLRSGQPGRPGGD